MSSTIFMTALLICGDFPIAGSRFKMTSEFGFVTLDLIEVYERDQGIYTCKAWNKSGEAFTSTTVFCSSKAGLIEKTQHPKGQEGLGKIQELEESLRKEQAATDDAEEGQPPVFTSQVLMDIRILVLIFITTFMKLCNLYVSPVNLFSGFSISIFE